MSEVRSGVWSHVGEDEVKDFMSLLNKAEEVLGSPVKAISFLAGGLTNKSYKLTFENDKMAVMRLAGKGTEDYINRAAEKHNSTAMGELGIAPAVYYFEADTGCQISEFITLPTVHMEDFQQKKDVQENCAKIMKLYHTSGVEFQPQFDPVKGTMDYFKICDDVNWDYKKFYPDFDKTLATIQRIDAIYKKNPPAPGPCHCDVLAENFMYDGTTMKLIDWEYGGQYEPWYDVAGPITENQLTIDDEAAKNYLAAYCGGEPTEEELARVLVNMFIYCTYWSAWSWVQMATGGKDPAIYEPYGKERADVGTEYMNDPRFEKFLQILDK